MMKIINGPQVTAQLSAGLKDIARLTGFSEKVVTKGEAGAILKTWAGRTKVAKPAQIDYRARKRALHGLGFTKTSEIGGITVNTGTRAQAGRMWVKTAGKRGKGWKLAGRLDPHTFQFTPANYHWKDKDWIDIKEAAIDSELAIKRETQLGQQSAGLARQSVVQIADKLGEAEEAGETLPVRDLIAISRDAADRFGYGKKQTNVNVNADFASMLERTIDRSRKARLIEGTTNPSTAVAAPSDPAGGASSGGDDLVPTEVVTPFIRRRV